jgi:hypothetical protein
LTNVDITGWSGEGDLTARLIEEMRSLAEIALVRVEDAPASRADSAFSFISNEVFVGFARAERRVRIRKFGFIPRSIVVMEKLMTLPRLESVLSSIADIGEPDYADEGMLQYLRTQRIIPPYQTRGIKLVELVRIYEASARSMGSDPSSMGV